MLAIAPLGILSAPRGAKFSQFDLETPMTEFRRGDEVLRVPERGRGLESSGEGRGDEVLKTLPGRRLCSMLQAAPTAAIASQSSDPLASPSSP